MSLASGVRGFGPVGRKRVATGVRVGLSVVLLLVLLQRVALAEVLQLLTGMLDSPGLLVLAALLPGLGTFVGVLRWRALLAGVGATLRLRVLMSAILVGAFFNQFLPSTIGGDVVRSWWSERAVGSGLVSFTVVGVDRAIGFVGVCVVGAVAALFQPFVVRDISGFWWIIAGAAAATGAVALLLRPGTGSLAARLLRIPLLRPIRDRAETVYRALLTFRGEPGALSSALLLSVLLQVGIIAQYLVLSRALGIQVAAGSLAVVIPIVTLVSLLPVTVNGIGIREGALATLGSAIGFGTGDAIALAWAFLFFQLLWALMGGMIYLAHGRDGHGRAHPPLRERRSVAVASGAASAPGP